MVGIMILRHTGPRSGTRIQNSNNGFPLDCPASLIPVYSYDPGRAMTGKEIRKFLYRSLAVFGQRQSSYETRIYSEEDLPLGARAAYLRAGLFQ